MSRDLAISQDSAMSRDNAQHFGSGDRAEVTGIDGCFPLSRQAHRPGQGPAPHAPQVPSGSHTAGAAEIGLFGSASSLSSPTRNCCIREWSSWTALWQCSM